MGDLLPPLNSNTPIVESSTGRPKLAFVTLINQLLSGSVTSAVALAQAAQTAVTALAATVAGKADKTTQINTTAPIQGGGDLSANRTISLADTAVTPGTYGDATHVAQFTVDQKGRITAAANVAITGGGGGGGGGSGSLIGLTRSYVNANFNGGVTNAYVSVPFDNYEDAVGAHTAGTSTFTVPVGVSLMRVTIEGVMASLSSQVLWRAINNTTGATVYLGYRTKQGNESPLSATTAWLSVTPGHSWSVQCFFDSNNAVQGCGAGGTATDGTRATFEWTTSSSLLSGSGGGGSIEAYFNSNDVSASTGTLPTTMTALFSVTIAPSSVARTFLVSGTLVWNSAGNSIRGGIMRDGVVVWPNTVTNPGIDSISAGDGMDHMDFAGTLVTIPGDGASHTISLCGNAQINTSALTMQNRHIAAIKVG